MKDLGWKCENKLSSNPLQFFCQMKNIQVWGWFFRNYSGRCGGGVCFYHYYRIFGGDSENYASVCMQEIVMWLNKWSAKRLHESTNNVERIWNDGSSSFKIELCVLWEQKSIYITKKKTQPIQCYLFANTPETKQRSGQWISWNSANETGERTKE